MPRYLKMALLPLCCVVLLTACGETKLVTRVETVRQTVPVSLLECPEFPGRRPIETQKDIAHLLADAWEAHGDCAEKLRQVRSLMEGNGK